ncbi:MAG: glycosyltransferase, partial [Planctomycetota bacterium]
LVTIDRFATLSKVVELLRRQTTADRVQLLIVAPDESTLSDLDDEVRESFADITAVVVGPITDIDMASAEAVPHARAPFVAFLEDHAFPDSDWAERIVETFRSQRCAGVGTAIENANPGTVLSWANMLVSYGSWIAAEHPGATTNVSRHNVAFRTDVLRGEYGDDLPSMMGRDGGLLSDLLRRGHGYALQPATCVRHVNPSTWRSTIELRLGSGRLFASSRMRREKWSPAKRWMYIIGGPAIPVIRFRMLRSELLGPGSEARRQRVGQRAIPALVVACVLDGIGQFLGHALGPGRIKEKLAFFEMGRARHLRAGEKHLMTDLEA